jgi:aspartate/methionine/tyrosine aminotransferase
MNIKPSKRGDAPSHAEELSLLAEQLRKEGKSIIALSVGQPSTGAPEPAIAAVQQAETLHHGYTPAAGIPELRQRIAQHYKEKYNVTISPNRVLVTNGASGAFSLAFIGCFDVGQTIGVPLPCYYSYLNTLNVLGLKKTEFHPLMANHLQPTVNDLKNLSTKIDGLLVTSPSNPTGSMIPPNQLKDLIDYCQKNNIIFISDEIYHGIVYNKDTPAMSALNYSDDVIVINSFSKYFSMPGWRLGWIVVPESLVESMQKLARNLYISPPGPSQYTALAAFECKDILDEHIKRYAKNRDILLENMPKAGFDLFPPLDGAFYLYAHVKHLTKDSVEFCKKMLRETGIIATPGTDFDPIHGHHYVRFSYAGSTEDILEATKRLIEWRQKI